MTLNIKDPESHKLARKLADQTGETMTRAVTEALRARPARVSRTQKPHHTAGNLLTIGRRCAAMLKGKPMDHGSLLYDGRGLPK